MNQGLSSCQRCRQPLKLLEDSINILSPSQYDIISNSINIERSYLNSHQPSSQPSPTSIISNSRNPLYQQSINRTTSTSTTSNLPQVKITSQYNNKPSSTTLGPEESFFLLTESVVRPARIATTLNNNNNTSFQPQSNQPHSTSSPINSLESSTSNSTTTPLTPRLAQLVNLYSVLSSNGNIDYPLCTECMENLIRMMEKELEDGKKQKDRLILFEREINKKREEGGIVGKQVYEKEISRLKRAEKNAIDELTSVEAQRTLLDEEKAALDAEEAELAEEEAQFWRDHSKNLLTAASLRDKTNSLETKYAHDVRELEKLQKTNVYNDAFCIGQENSFATINGLRLGRLPNIPVEWPEINAAWGHTLLLLHTIARKFGLTFETYRLVPMGSFSRIEKLSGDKAVYELYGSGDFAVTRLLQNRRFDMAMVAFLDCLRQVQEFVKSKDSNLKLPHAVHKDRIGEVSIKLQFGSDETWTRALRHVLLDLKILLGRASQ